MKGTGCRDGTLTDVTARAKLKKIVGGVHNSNLPTWKTSFEPTLPTNRIFLEFYQQQCGRALIIFGNVPKS